MIWLIFIDCKIRAWDSLLGDLKPLWQWESLTFSWFLTLNKVRSNLVNTYFLYLVIIFLLKIIFNPPQYKDEEQDIGNLVIPFLKIIICKPNERLNKSEYNVKKFLLMNHLSSEEIVEYENAKQVLDKSYDHIADECILHSTIRWYK